MLFQSSFNNIVTNIIRCNVFHMTEEDFYLLVQDHIALKREFKDYKAETINILNRQSVVIENQFAVISAIQKQVNEMTAFMMPTIPEETPQKH